MKIRNVLVAIAVSGMLALAACSEQTGAGSGGGNPYGSSGAPAGSGGAMGSGGGSMSSGSSGSSGSSSNPMR